jgi:hypothetical protein
LTCWRSRRSASKPSSTSSETFSACFFTPRSETPISCNASYASLTHTVCSLCESARLSHINSRIMPLLSCWLRRRRLLFRTHLCQSNPIPHLLVTTCKTNQQPSRQPKPRNHQPAQSPRRSRAHKNTSQQQLNKTNTHQRDEIRQPNSSLSHAPKSIIPTEFRVYNQSFRSLNW